MSKCELCGEPMPSGEEMFTYHGYSGPCPKKPEVKFCINCGEHHSPDTECPFIWMECGHCKEHHKAAPDMPMVVHQGVPTGVICGNCGKDDGWTFYTQEHFKD